MSANAARIVACVNACEGINPEAVPDILRALEAMLVYYNRDQAERGLLGCAPCADMAEQALAKAKAKNA